MHILGHAGVTDVRNRAAVQNAVWRTDPVDASVWRRWTRSVPPVAIAASTCDVVIKCVRQVSQVSEVRIAYQARVVSVRCTSFTSWIGAQDASYCSSSIDILTSVTRDAYLADVDIIVANLTEFDSASFVGEDYRVHAVAWQQGRRSTGWVGGCCAFGACTV